jgi:hypothetical protein
LTRAGALLAACALLGLALGCAPLPTDKPGWVEDRLYFGLNMPSGQVSAGQWDAFLSEEVTPRFPDGLTVLDGQGQWKGGSGSVEKEPSKVLELDHPDTSKADAAIAEIVAAYKVRFHQQSVMTVRHRAEVTF